MSKTRGLTYSALLIALSVVATRWLSIQTPIVRIGFGGIPILLAGLFLGPVWGFACGALADLVGFFMNPVGAYFPGFTLSAGLVGLIVPLILGKRRLISSYGRLLSAVAVSQLITSLLLDTYWLTIILGKTAGALLPFRALNQAIYIPVATGIIFVLRRVLRRFLPSQSFME